MNSFGPDAFCVGRSLTIDSVSLTKIGLFRLPVSCVSFGVLCLVFQRIGPFHLGYQICGDKIF